MLKPRRRRSSSENSDGTQTASVSDNLQITTLKTKADQDPPSSKANQSVWGDSYALLPDMGDLVDPFASLPFTLDHKSQALLDHFFSGLEPVAYLHDAHADFATVKRLVFNIGLISPPAFHVILAASASDIAVLHGREDSEDSIAHRGHALGLVKRNLWARKPEQLPSDDSLGGIALLAGNEVS